MTALVESNRSNIELGQSLLNVRFTPGSGRSAIIGEKGR
jgi:hypothetical protein